MESTHAPWVFDLYVVSNDALIHVLEVSGMNDNQSKKITVLPFLASNVDRFFRYPVVCRQLSKIDRPDDLPKIGEGSVIAGHSRGGPLNRRLDTLKSSLPLYTKPTNPAKPEIWTPFCIRTHPPGGLGSMTDPFRPISAIRERWRSYALEPPPKLPKTTGEVLLGPPSETPMSTSRVLLNPIPGTPMSIVHTPLQPPVLPLCPL